MVIPRSRSSSIESSICGTWVRASTAPVTSRMRSASVDLPWSMWAMIEKFLICSMGDGRVRPPARDQGGALGQALLLARGSDRLVAVGEELEAGAHPVLDLPQVEAGLVDLDAASGPLGVEGRVQQDRLPEHLHPVDLDRLLRPDLR